MKRLTDFESLDDFGFTSIIGDAGKVEFIKCDSDFEKVEDTIEGGVVFANGDLTTGKFFTLDTILSGGTLTIPIDDTIVSNQAELSLDYSLATSLAYLGSVYSTVLGGINKIKETYPNGFAITDATTGVSTIMFNNSNTTTYGSAPFSVSDYTEYELIQSLSGVYDKTFVINSSTSLTGGTYSLLFLDGTPSTGGTYAHMVQPKESSLDKFYSTVTPYELDLLVPPADRSNYFPRDPVATRNILFEGTEYDDFVDTELSWGTLADNNDTNFIWRKLYPDGQKILDSDDSIMQKLVLSLAMSFDNIKRYQDQLKYQHTIGYETSNHISKDLVEKLANQWNWTLGQNLNQDDYSEFVYSQYANYITGQSQQKLSAKDVNFEIWRRVLANLVTLYKKKGTEEAIKYVANMYGLPEALLWVEELVKIAGNRGDELIESLANIVVSDGTGRMQYVDSTGSATTLPYRVIGNTKYLNINISPFDAIEFDFWDWGWENHPDILGVNGTYVVVSSTTEISQYTFFKRILNATIKSDGSARYDDRYPLLEAEADIYYTTSVNQMSLATLEPYMDFLDDNWNVLMTNLVPASSKLLSIGTLYRNPMWRREKHQWNDSELDTKDLPFNEDLTIPAFIPLGELEVKLDQTIDITDVTGSIDTLDLGTIDTVSLVATNPQSLFGIVESMTETGTHTLQPQGSIDENITTGEFVSGMTDSEDLNITFSGESFVITSPRLDPISGQSGTLDYLDYNTNSLVVNNTNSFDVIFSASNLSDGGYSKFEFYLYKKAEDEVAQVDDTLDYSIMSVELEDGRYGRYRVSSVANLEEFDYIKISSEYLPFINEFVQVTYIDTATTQIRTEPPIGLFTLPVGVDNTVVDWFDFISTGALSRLRLIFQLKPTITYEQVIRIMTEISDYTYGGNLIDVPDIAEAIFDAGLEQHEAGMFVWWAQQDAGIVFGALLVLEFVKGNTQWNLSSPDYPLINQVAANQTKATFNRVVNFFNWTQPDQTINYANLLSGVYSQASIGISNDVLFSGSNDVTERGVIMTLDNDTSFSSATRTIVSAGESFTEHIEQSWLPLKIDVASDANTGQYTVTALTEWILSVEEAIVDSPEGAGSGVNILYPYEIISAATLDFSSFVPGNFVHIAGSSSNDGDHKVVYSGSTGDYVVIYPTATVELPGAPVTVSILYTASTDQGDFTFPALDTANRTELNDYSTTGTVMLGGLNYLNANILVDKHEYFYKYRALTHAPISWGDVQGMIPFPIFASGGTIIDSGYDVAYKNRIKYFGRYFMYMITPKVPVSSVDNLTDGVTDDASVTIKWHGVGDSDRLELQYLPQVSATDPFGNENGDGYTAITESSWSSSGRSINIEARDNVGDDYIYTIQTTLEPDTYYWWRVKNFRNKVSMFGHNLEYYTSTRPEQFKTGGFAGGGAVEGENPTDPEAPEIIIINDPDGDSRDGGFPNIVGS